MIEDTGWKGFGIKKLIGAINKLFGGFEIGQQFNITTKADGAIPSRGPNFKTMQTGPQVDLAFQSIQCLFVRNRTTINREEKLGWMPNRRVRLLGNLKLTKIQFESTGHIGGFVKISAEPIDYMGVVMPVLAQPLYLPGDLC